MKLVSRSRRSPSWPNVTGDVEIDEYSRKVADYIAERYSDGYRGVPGAIPTPPARPAAPT
jgi:hypothetical protein